MRPGDTGIVVARPLLFLREPKVFSYEITCSNCGWRTVCGLNDAIVRLRLAGHFRREREPDEETVAVLLVESTPLMTCPLCKEKRRSRGLRLNRTLMMVPTIGKRQCCAIFVASRSIRSEWRRYLGRSGAACQGKAESGQLTEEPDYCPNCGALIEVRVSRGSGITRYRRVCTGEPPCRL